MNEGRDYDVDFGSLPLPGGFRIVVQAPDNGQLHHIDETVLKVLPPSGQYSSQDLIEKLLHAVAEAAKQDDGSRWCSSPGAVEIAG